MLDVQWTSRPKEQCLDADHWFAAVRAGGRYRRDISEHVHPLPLTCLLCTKSVEDELYVHQCTYIGVGRIAMMQIQGAC
jgi:hypothetical protein